ncbi:YceI family protein [Chitinophaga pendula]|uniref:YceI family protein n=1 Tax=Chitinophaga TaxID=79328 RepID=UPI000BAE850D|nr:MULTISPECIES: YceI family protein [Chitinophaga]ASZ09930.1 hypothetical protein CK934_02510 [Chitinophaga sp. MD30]UCJ07130.1 YceI family protein [Chitinophaga pendula]
MKKLLALLAASMLTAPLFAQDIYSCRNVSLSFFSEAPMENIDAKTDKGVSAINLKTGNVYFKVPVNTFQFKKKLMQEHFNENYLETDKFPSAEFKGKLLNAPDFSKPGTYEVNVEGTLSLHGVDKTYREKGTLTVGDKQITLHSGFNVKLADHQIKIPTLVIKNIAEIVAVKIQAAYEPK